MRKVSWIDKDKTHFAVIATDGRYVNLTATKNDFFVQLIGETEEEINYSSSAKNLNDAKRLAEAFGHSLLESSQETPENEVSTNGQKVDALQH